MSGERKLERCENGHYYDADKFLTCPHCEAMKLGLNTTREHFRRVMGEKLKETMTETRVSDSDMSESKLGEAVRKAMEKRAEKS